LEEFKAKKNRDWTIYDMKGALEISTCVVKLSFI
jgi:hypothetical protein